MDGEYITVESSIDHKLMPVETSDQVHYLQWFHGTLIARMGQYNNIWGQWLNIYHKATALYNTIILKYVYIMNFKNKCENKFVRISWENKIGMVKSPTGFNGFIILNVNLVCSLFSRWRKNIELKFSCLKSKFLHVSCNADHF